MSFEVLDINTSWNEDAHSEDIYYKKSYYALCQHIQEGEARCFVFTYKDHTCIYPFFLRQIPGTVYFDIEGAYGYNGVSNAPDDHSYAREFYRAFSDYCHEQGIIAEFTRFHPLLNNHIFSQGFLHIVKNRTTVYTDLQQDYNDIWQNEYPSSSRNKIRKARKLGVDIWEADKLTDFLSFGRMLREHLAAKGSDPFYLWPDQYFKELFEWPVLKRQLFLASYNDILLGGALFLIGDKFMHYHASARSEDYPGVPPANLLLDHAIQWGIHHGYVSLHLGGGLTAHRHDPLLGFKQNFSSFSADFFIGTMIHNRGIYNGLISSWEEEHPGKAKEYANYFLRYRLK